MGYALAIALKCGAGKGISAGPPLPRSSKKGIPAIAWGSPHKRSAQTGEPSPRGEGDLQGGQGGGSAPIPPGGTRPARGFPRGLKNFGAFGF